jgi:hypothetical protein
VSAPRCHLQHSAAHRRVRSIRHALAAAPSRAAPHPTVRSYVLPRPPGCVPVSPGCLITVPNSTARSNFADYSSLLTIAAAHSPTAASQASPLFAAPLFAATARPRFSLQMPLFALPCSPLSASLALPCLARPTFLALGYLTRLARPTCFALGYLTRLALPCSPCLAHPWLPHSPASWQLAVRHAQRASCQQPSGQPAHSQLAAVRRVAISSINARSSPLFDVRLSKA